MPRRRAAAAPPRRPRGRARAAARRPRAAPRTHSGSTLGAERVLGGHARSRSRPGSRRAARARTARRAAAPTSRRRPRSRPSTSSSCAVSATVRVSTPSRRGRSRPRSGPREIRPRLGLRPTSPQQAAGMRIEPPPSLPWASGTIPAATAAAEPPEEPPGRARRVPRVAGRARVARLGGRQDPELRQVRHADDDEPRVAQPAHEVGVVRRAVPASSEPKFMHRPATGRWP